jgi:peptidoglycan/xylan/chitin deacetylase (PgdA/CDA1 family)
MHDQGMEIGGHTLNHPILKNLILEDVKQEVLQNKIDLEKIIDSPVRFFAYPNGRLGEDYLPEHADIVKKCGYEAAFSTDRGEIDKNSILWQLPRFSPWDKSRLRFILRMIYNYLF